MGLSDLIEEVLECVWMSSRLLYRYYYSVE